MWETSLIPLVDLWWVLVVEETWQLVLSCLALMISFVKGLVQLEISGFLLGM